MYILCLTINHKLCSLVIDSCILLLKYTYVHGDFLNHLSCLFSDILQPWVQPDLRQRSLCSSYSFASEPEPSGAKVSPDIYSHVSTVFSFTLNLCMCRRNFYIYIGISASVGALLLDTQLFSDILQPWVQPDLRQRSLCSSYSFASEPEPSGAKVSPAIYSHVSTVFSFTLNLCAGEISTYI